MSIGWEFFHCFVILSMQTDEWENFLERVNCSNEEELRDNEDLEEELRLWASYRGQTLTRTGTELLLYLVKLLF